jgi:NadR type nicotinamide-nucleotide adenylyltransferase
MNNIGITIGKFMPLHVGHELMIEFGIAMCNELNIIVSGKETDVIPLSVRWAWVNEKYGHLPNVFVHDHTDESPTPINVDEHGTVLDSEYQEYWKNEFTRMAPHATHFVSSDFYGQTMADLLGIEWMPVDPLREMFEISATQIRSNPIKYFQYISNVAKPYFTKKIAIVGPESSGKSTMVKNLAHHYNGNIVHEYGRTLSEAKKNDLTKDDFMQITEGQQALIDIAINKGRSPYLFIDTEAYVTYLFSKIYLDEYTEEILEYGKNQEIDHYIVLAPTVKWVNDGTRILGDQEKRERFFNNLTAILIEHKKSYTIIDSKDFAAREQQAINYINKLQ